MDVETRDAILQELVTLVTADEKLPVDSTTHNSADANAEAVERVLVEWFSGKPHGLQFECDQSDLDLFISYMKAAVPLESLEQVLASLLKSQYVATLPQQLRCIGCLPRIHFRALHPPYIADYNKLVKQYKLQKYVAKQCTTQFTDDALQNGVNSDVYMCFIRFNELYVVNMLPAIGVRH